MPWLVATALLHSALATERTGAFRTWTLLLAIAGFSLSLIGTFLVRSGVLSSVHAFASDPTRGFFILVLIACAIGGALALFAWRAPNLEGGAAFEPVSRETALLLNNVFLVAACAAVFRRHALSAGAGCADRHQDFRRPALFRASPSRRSSSRCCCWCRSGRGSTGRRGDLKAACARLAPALGLAGIAAVAVLALASPRSVAGSRRLRRGGLADRRQRNRHPQAQGRARCRAFAAALAHAGLGVTLMGVAGTTLWRSEALDGAGPGRNHAGRALHACASTA